MLLLALVQRSPANERDGKKTMYFFPTPILCSVGPFIYPRPVARSHQCSLLACKQPGLFPSPITEGGGGEGEGGGGEGEGRSGGARPENDS